MLEASNPRKFGYNGNNKNHGARPGKELQQLFEERQTRLVRSGLTPLPQS